jgi:dipeptidyl aminopeptidase/acylaminoacyl peptidase
MIPEKETRMTGNWRRAALAVLLALLMQGTILRAQNAESKPDSSEPARKEWKPEDVVFTETAGQFRISPDGKWAVWVKSVADREKDSRVSNLLLSSLTEKKEIQLTRGTETHAQPRWSPNGELISFLSTRPLPRPAPEKARQQLWLMNPFGGEPWSLTEFERGIRSYEWVDNDTIYFTAEEDATFYEHETRRKKDDTSAVEDAAHTAPVRLFRLSVKDRKVTRLTDNDDWIQSWAASPDGKKVVAVHERSLAYTWDQKIPPVTFLYDLETGQRKQIFTEGRIRPFGIRWAKDGSGFYAGTPFSNHPEFLNATIDILYFYDVRSGSATQVNLDWEWGFASQIETAQDGFVCLLSAGARFLPARYTRSGSAWTRANLEGEHARNLFGFVLGQDGKTLLYNHSKPDKPTQWYRATLDGTRIVSPVQMTSVNPHFQNKPLAKAEVIRWKGALDEEVEGVLYYPHNYEPGKRYPLVLNIHGGPTGFDTDDWSASWGTPLNLLAQRGAFVFQVNYHGSGNYGLKWAESICCGKYYDLEIPDIEKGVDALIARGLVDPERIGTMGWSNGSILSIQLLVTNPARYKAASAGAGDVEWISDWANVDFGQAFDKYYLGKSPLEDPELYIRKSPFFKLDRVQTPIIIYFGTEDRNVPTSQGWSTYRALYQAGKVPVRFLLFPGEPHGPQKLSHQLRKVEEEMAWFDRYLFKKESANEAFKEDSPLGLAFRRKAIARASTRYGVAQTVKAAKGAPQEALIPEVVKRGDLEIGRFEVTRAQYAAFDKNYKYDAGTDNFPANGVTLENARAYAAWLSKLTGQTYRIPNEDEVTSLYESRSGENTLDYWAGYTVNPADAERLAAKLKELGGTAPLLKEAGSFAGAGGEGEELIFDLGGNVAEWALAKDGTGKTLGGSADRPADTKTQYRAADAAYVGLRVVRGEPKKKDAAPEKK